MKKMIVLLLYAFTLTSCANKAAGGGEMNTLNIPGTHLYMTVPKNYKLATNFAGFTINDEAAISVMDIIGGSYYSNGATFTKENFEANNIKVIGFEMLKIDGYPAKYALIKAADGTTGLGLIFGDSTFSATVSVQMSKNNDLLMAEIKQAISTITYDKKLKLDPFAHAKFTIDDSHSKLKYAKYSAGMYVYSLDGKNKVVYGDNEPMAMVIPLPTDGGLTVEAMFKENINSMEKYGLTNKDIRHVSTEKVNGYDAYEAEVYCKMKGKDKVMYFLELTHGANAIMFSGSSVNDTGKTLTEMKKLAHTVHFKE